MINKPLNFGPPIRLATKQQLALELIAREDDENTEIYVIMKCEDGDYECYSVFPSDDGTIPPLSPILRRLADRFDSVEPACRPQCKY